MQMSVPVGFIHQIYPNFAALILLASVKTNMFSK